MTLSEGVPGKVYNVLDVKQEMSIERRLSALGLISGTKISLLNKKKIKHTTKDMLRKDK